MSELRVQRLAEMRRQLRLFGENYVRLSISEMPAGRGGHGDPAAGQALRHLLETHGRFARMDDATDDELENTYAELTKLACRARLQPVLEFSGMPNPTYNHFAAFDENNASPWDPIPLTREAVTPARWQLLGVPVRYPLGIPASSLTSSADWIEFHARKGFNVLTFKTVRSHAASAHPFPNWVFLEPVEPWRTPADVGPVIGDLETWPRDFRNCSTANSFGVPSPEPEVWLAEVRKALNVLDDGQILIVSVMGSERYAGQDLIDDFLKVARLAASTGAPAIELNLSCPNTPPGGPSSPSTIAPPLCQDDPALTAEIVRAVTESLRPEGIRVVAKLSYLPKPELQSLLKDRGVGEMVDAIAGINTVQTKVTHRNGTPTFVGFAGDPSAERGSAGVSGAAIKHLGIDFCSSLAEIRRHSRLDFEILAMGGVQGPSDIADYWRAGADAIQTATGAFANPDMPSEVQIALQGALGHRPRPAWDLARRVFSTRRLDLLRAH